MKFKDILVIKVGTSTLTDANVNGTGGIDSDSFVNIGEQLITLQEAGHGIVLVSSAAISSGMAHLGITERPNRDTSMPELQRLASIGWRHILNEWSTALPDITIGELLITKREIEPNREEGDELMRVISALLSHGDVAIANENDAITHSEIAFGDNDTLAASLAAKIAASQLFNCEVKLLLLTDVDGVYRNKEDATTLISVIDDIAASRHLAGESESKAGTGGMRTKFIAAGIATRAHVATWVGNGRRRNSINEMLSYENGTYFVPATQEKPPR